jgi:peptidoglycan/LPS O-acetylase OafA/YrhL
VQRFDVLDFVRAAASFSVLVWHYQHFYQVTPGRLAPGFDRAAQPFYGVFWLLYEHGYWAVQLFFVLSGFVFFHQYADLISRRVVTPKSFFILRFSRLYPLHLVTLLLVAAGQVISQTLDGQFVVYSCNTAQNFLINIFFISYWVDPCGSFNGPIWSVSAEVFVYAIFLLVALSLSTSRTQWFIVAFSAIVVGVAFSKGAPVFCFFSGGLCFLLWERFQSTRYASICMFLAAGALAISCGYFYAYGVQYFVLLLVTMPAVILISNFGHAAERPKRARQKYSFPWGHHLLNIFASLSVATCSHFAGEAWLAYD